MSVMTEYRKVLCSFIAVGLDKLWSTADWLYTLATHHKSLTACCIAVSGISMAAMAMGLNSLLPSRKRSRSEIFRAKSETDAMEHCKGEEILPDV